MGSLITRRFFVPMYSRYIRFDNLVVVNVHDRTSVDLPPMNNVVNRADHCDTSKHNHTVVHVCNRSMVEEREEADDGLHDAEQESDDVDWNTLFDR